MSNSAASGGCDYTLTEQGIHQFIFREATKEAIDDFFHKLEAVFVATSGVDTNRYILDITQSGERNVSLVTNVQRFRRLETLFPNRPRGRTAILHRPGLAYTLIDSFIRALAPSRDITRFFPVDERDEAIAWLLSESR
ncbi:MAG: hypothetical protein GC179_13220 [Anaerolineaceae bacterium]|nr:hypothetical protein [Anaerolineaceae bacterium]